MLSINLELSKFQLQSLNTQKGPKNVRIIPIKCIHHVSNKKNQGKNRLQYLHTSSEEYMNGSQISREVVKVCELTVSRIGSSTGTIWLLFPWQRLLHQSIRFLPASRYPAPQPLPSKYSTRCRYSYKISQCHCNIINLLQF